jgi:hypothetical protein
MAGNNLPMIYFLYKYVNMLLFIGTILQSFMSVGRRKCLVKSKDHFSFSSALFLFPIIIYLLKKLLKQWATCDLIQEFSKGFRKLE